MKLRQHEKPVPVEFSRHGDGRRALWRVPLVRDGLYGFYAFVACTTCFGSYLNNSVKALL